MARDHSILFILFFALFIGTCSYNLQAGIEDSLVAYWPLDDSLADVTGNGHDGEMINGVVTYIPGIKGGAVKLPGTEDARISYPVWAPGDSSITVSGWVYVASKDEFWMDYKASLLTAQRGDCENAYILKAAYRFDELRIEFAIHGNYVSDHIYYAPDPEEFYGKWHHLVGIVDRQIQSVKLYYDAQVVSAGALSIGAIYPTKSFLGSYDYITARDGATRFVSPSHRLDEIRLYSRALTDAEILELYNGVNSAPVVDAGEDVNIEGEDVSNTVIIGSGSDEDIEDSLLYRWLEAETIMLDWTSVTNDECPLSLDGLGLGIGTHTLTLEVTDNRHTISDYMTLTIENSASNLAPSGGGIYQIYSPVTLGGEVSDYDGDHLYYKWLHEAEQIDIGEIQTIAGNIPVALPNLIVNDLPLGTHTFTLQVNDTINPIQSKSVIANITDSEAPILAPVASKSILWPPKRKMLPITITVNAYDNSGGPLTLSAIVSSSEPTSGLWPNDLSPDWTLPIIDQETGTIDLFLRAECSLQCSVRTYTITITAEDESGNQSTSTLEIIAPHDKRKN
jgi:hypothetical protein